MNKEVKHFFVENNHLNKIAPNLDHKNIHRTKGEFEGLMPPPEVLQAYEEIMPGTVEKLLGLMEQEQKHKHAMEKAKIFMHSKTETVGKLFASFTIIIIAYATITLSNKSLNHALAFSAIAFASIFAVSIMTRLKTNNSPIEERSANIPFNKNNKASRPNWQHIKNKRTINKKG